MPRYRYNAAIRVPEVRVLDRDGNNLGVMTTNEALRRAEEQEMDMVEINPKADPPVVKLMNFSHFKYQKEKELRKQKINAHVAEMKGIRLSIRISDHDLEVRQKQAEKFLARGDKVQIEIILRGREKGKGELADEVIKKFHILLSQTVPVKYEQTPKRQGGKVTAIIVKA